MATADPLHWSLVRAFFKHAADERLMIPECTECGETHFPPRVVCPYCLSSAVELTESAGDGTVYSYSVVHIDYHRVWGESAPYVNALIDLTDGPIVFGNLVNCSRERVEVDAAVSVAFEAINGRTRPVFELHE